MKYIKLFEHTYSIYDLITMPEYQAGELLLKEIEKDVPDIQFIKDLFEYSKVYVNWQNSGDSTALMWASINAHTEISRMLLERPEIDVNLQDNIGMTALIWASGNDQTEIVQMLLERPEILVNLQNEDGSTALMRASWYGYPQIVKLLLERPETDVNLQTKNGWTAWDWMEPSIRSLFPQLKPN